MGETVGARLGAEVGKGVGLRETVTHRIVLRERVDMHTDMCIEMHTDMCMLNVNSCSPTVHGLC